MQQRSAAAYDPTSWTGRNLSVVPDASWVEVDGARIEVLSWGDPSAPGIILTHGYAANAHWWSAIGPALARTRRVVAFSYSGMGLSDWRDNYTIRQCVREIEGVAHATGLFNAPRPPVIAAHSFGGFSSLIAVVEVRNPGVAWS